MCVQVPAALKIASTIATAGSAAVNAYSSVKQGNAAYQSAQATNQAAQFNASVLRRNAQAVETDQVNVREGAAIERRRLGETRRGEKGEAIARAAAMGIDPNFGSAADVVSDVERAYSIDRNILGRNEITDLRTLDKERADYLDSAKLTEMEGASALRAGESARRAGYVGAVGSLLDGAASVSSRWIQPGSTATKGAKLRVGA